MFDLSVPTVQFRFNNFHHSKQFVSNMPSGFISALVSSSELALLLLDEARVGAFLPLAIEVLAVRRGNRASGAYGNHQAVRRVNGPTAS